MRVTVMYEYLFYKLYQWSRRINDKSELHEFNAVIMLSFVIMLNVATLPAIIQLITGYEVLDLFAVNKAYAVVFALSVLATNYILLARVIGFGNAIRAFEREDANRRREGNILVASYVIGSFCVLVASYFGVAMLR